jgi:dTDP-glucose 4,6-dehydratase
VNFLVTGGCGFIASHLVRLLLENGHAVLNLDKLTYAGNPANLADCETNRNYRFIRGDIADRAAVAPLLDGIDCVINAAAETHVDRSIDDAEAFLRTNVIGVHTLCEAIRETGRTIRFVQVSTDEVYGSIEEGAYRETDSFHPSSPYAAAKAGGELMAFSYHITHGMDVVATRGANTYGPNQFPEKLIPYFVTQLIEGKKVPVYGDGLNVRDWLHVRDHAAAILFVALSGKSGEAYNVPGLNERRNVEIVKAILDAMAADESRIERVKDRPGHDRRYAVDGSRLAALGFTHRESFATGLDATVRWYRENESWWRPVKEASQDFFARHYGKLAKNRN